MTSPGERINIPSVPNLRDLGGYATADGGRVLMGRLYRSVEVNHLGGADLETFAALGIRAVFDLRTQAERSAQPDVVPEGTKQVVCDVLADEHAAAPAQLLQLLSDPKVAQQLLGGGQAASMFEKSYRDIVSLPSDRAAYRTFFTSIARRDSLPALFHCTTGKDRTGAGRRSRLPGDSARRGQCKVRFD